jgi:hypothetical protein
MEVINKFRCFVIGWDTEILMECSKGASYGMLKKYMSAIMIMATIWGIIGWCIAQNYIGIESLWGKGATSSGFVAFIVWIERTIIQTVGRLGLIKWFRIILGVLMAVLGSTIFDQIFFEQDVAVKMEEIRTEQINKEVPKQIKLIDADLKKLSRERDSIAKVNTALYERLEKNPTVAAVDVKTVKEQTGTDAEGKAIFTEKQTYEKKNSQNPLNAQIVANDKILIANQERINELQNKKLSTADTVREKYEKMDTGFLEGLSALRHFLGEQTIALVFYIILFLFLACLELLVITSKGGDSKCEYDMYVEHQLKKRKEIYRVQEEKWGKEDDGK